MTSTYHFNNEDSSDPWQEWFIAERGTELESDVDECEQDDYSEGDYE